MTKPEYVRETSRGRTLHLFVIKSAAFGDTKVYLDASNRVKDGERADEANGYHGGGPMMGHEVEKARAYAAYVAQYATLESLYNFYSKDYFLFSDGQKDAAA